MVFGDSNAYRPGNGPNCWPAMLQRISGGTLRVANESCDGRTTRYDTGEYNGLGIIEEKIGKVQPIDIFLTALGINDLKRIYGPPNAEEIVAGIEQIRQAVYRLKPNVHFALATPAPMGNVIHGDLADAQHRLASVAEKYRRYASERKIPMIDLYLNLDPTTDLDLDGVHLNQRGRIKVANFVWDGIKKG